MSEDQVFTKEVAGILKLAEKAVCSMAQDGERPAFKVRSQPRLRAEALAGRRQAAQQPRRRRVQARRPGGPSLDMRAIESILEMGGGYVLDFTDRSFAELDVLGRLGDLLPNIEKFGHSLGFQVVVAAAEDLVRAEERQASKEETSA